MSSRPHLVPPSSSGATSGANGLDVLAALWEVVEGARSAPDAAPGILAIVCARTGADAAGLSGRDEHGQVVRYAVRGALLDAQPTPSCAATRDPVAHPLADGGMLRIDDCRGDETWPDWSAAAVRRGIRSACFLGLPPLRGQGVTLELYARRPHVFAGAASSLVVLTARHAGLVLRQVDRIAELEEAAETRALVGQASGLLMERYHLTAEQSMSYLVRSCERAGLPLREMARELVAAQDRSARRTRSPFPGTGRPGGGPRPAP